MNENIFRFTLSNTTEGSLVISEPDGWKDATLKLERDKEFHSLVEFYDQVFTFYGAPHEKYDGGYEYIKNILTYQGPDADVRVLVEISEDAGTTYETLFDGLLDLSSVLEIDFYKIQLGIVRDDFWSRFKNQITTSIDVQAANDIYGDARPVLNTITEHLTGQKIKKTFDGYLSEFIQFLEGASWVTSSYVQMDMNEITKNEIVETYSLPNQINAAIPPQKFTAQRNGDYIFDLRIEASGAAGVTRVAGNTYVRWYIRINDDSPTLFTETNYGTGSYISTVYTYAATVTLAAQDSVYIYGDIIADIAPLGVTAFFFIYSTQTVTTPAGNGSGNGVNPTQWTVEGFTEFPDSDAEAILIHEATQSVLDRIIGQDDTLYSPYLGNQATQRIAYDDEGCFSYSSIAKGLHKKGFTFTEKPFAISFDDIWKGLNPMFNLGLGYQEDQSDPDKTVIFIAPKDEFYDLSPILSLSWVDKIEHSIQTETIFKNIKIGYQKWESENISGLDEVQTKHEYTVPLKKVGEDLEVYSSFIAAALAQENMRRQSIEKSKDYRLDEDVFITHLFPSSPDYVPYTADNIGALEPDGTGLDYPKSRYNLLFTPARNFERWRNFFNGGVQFNDSYQFQTGEGNTDAVIDDGGGVCGIGEVGENDNIEIGSTYTFGIDVYTFEHPLSWSQYKTIRDNRKRGIEISRTDSGHETFFIKSLEWNPVTPKGRFTLIKGFPAIPIDGDCPTADTTLVTADNAIITADCAGGGSTPYPISASLDYNITSAPTWDAEFQASPSLTTYNENLVGNDSWTNSLSSTGSTSMIMTASKISNGGLSEGDIIVRFFKNGILNNTQLFGLGDDVSNVTHTISGLTGGESFEITIEETLEDFIISAELTPFDPTISYRIQYVGYPNLTLTGTSSISKIKASPSSSFDIDTNVLKLTNAGVAEDAGVILWKRNGVTENTENFVLGDSVSYSYTFTGVVPGDELLVEIFEG